MRRTYCDRCGTEQNVPVVIHASYGLNETQHIDLCGACWGSVLDLIHDHEREPV